MWARPRVDFWQSAQKQNSMKTCQARVILKTAEGSKQQTRGPIVQNGHFKGKSIDIDISHNMHTCSEVATGFFLCTSFWYCKYKIKRNTVLGSITGAAC